MSVKEAYDYYAKEGYLNAHVNGGLTLYNYTDKCVFQNNWNFHTKSARGLVLDQDGNVIAKSFDKFWNLNERPETMLSALPQETPELSDKYDGSMVSIFENPETKKWQAVTRGCWDNIQTQFANQWLGNGNSARLEPSHTYIFELVAPWNRIVVAYSKEDMILIGRTHTKGGFDFSYKDVRDYALASGLTPVYFESRPLNSLNMEDPSVVNREGFVARFSNGLRIKIKYAQYILLHRILTGLSTKGIWESLAQGNEIDLSRVPAEFLDWFKSEKCKILDAHKELERRVKEVFNGTPKFATRKEYAAAFLQHKDIAPALFTLLDGKDCSEFLWEKVKPHGHATFQNESFNK
jgi:RNA ligase